PGTAGIEGRPRRLLAGRRHRAADGVALSGAPRRGDRALDLSTARCHRGSRAQRGEPRYSDLHGAWAVRRPDSDGAGTRLARAPGEARLRDRMARLPDAPLRMRSRDRGYIRVLLQSLLALELAACASMAEAPILVR